MKCPKYITTGNSSFRPVLRCFLFSEKECVYLNKYPPSPLFPNPIGGDFLMSHVRVNSQGVGERCYFATTADGKPVKLQRKPYTECFYVMALAELHRATENLRYQVQGWEVQGPERRVSGGGGGGVSGRGQD